MKRIPVFLLLAVGIMAFVPAGTSWAIDAREAMGAPAGTNYFQFLYQRVQGSNLYKDGNKISNSASVTINGEAFRYGHFWGVGKDMTFLFSAIFPYYADFNANGAAFGNQQQVASGLNDTTALFAFWPLADWKNRHWFAGAFWVTAPIGDYDNKRAVNIGRNVWTLRPELAWIKGWGPFYLQLVADLYYDTDNTNFGAKGQTLQRNFKYRGEAHATYNFTPDYWVGVSWYYDNGYQSKVQQTGVYNNDNLNDHTIGVSMNYSISKNLSLLVSSNYKATTNNGSDQVEVFRLKLTYAY